MLHSCSYTRCKVHGLAVHREGCNHTGHARLVWMQVHITMTDMERNQVAVPTEASQSTQR